MSIRGCAGPATVEDESVRRQPPPGCEMVGKEEGHRPPSQKVDMMGRIADFW